MQPGNRPTEHLSESKTGPKIVHVGYGYTVGNVQTASLGTDHPRHSDEQTTFSVEAYEYE